MTTGQSYISRSMPVKWMGHFILLICRRLMTYQRLPLVRALPFQTHPSTPDIWSRMTGVLTWGFLMMVYRCSSLSYTPLPHTQTRNMSRGFWSIPWARLGIFQPLIWTIQQFIASSTMTLVPVNPALLLAGTAQNFLSLIMEMIMEVLMAALEFGNTAWQLHMI